MPRRSSPSQECENLAQRGYIAFPWTALPAGYPEGFPSTLKDRPVEQRKIVRPLDATARSPTSARA